MRREDDPPFLPISTEDVPWEEWSDVPRFGLRFRHLSGALLGDDYHIGVAIEELPPGKQTSPQHYHILEEEHVFVLEGRLTARIGEHAFDMKAGDYVCFPAGWRAGHCLVNGGDSPCRYVMIGESNPDEVVVYTASRKVLVRSIRALLDLDATRGYWDGEETGLPDGDVPVSGRAARKEPEPQAPRPPIASDDGAWDEQGGGALFGGRSRHLTVAACGEGYHVGVLIEAPFPGKRMALQHYHMLEEEHALILEGEVTLLLGDERIEMGPGDYVGFPAGRRVGHSFQNSGNGPCRYLMIGARNPGDVCVYPDANRMQVRAVAAEDDVFDMGRARSYRDDAQGG